MLRSLAAASLVACLSVPAAHAQNLDAICRRAGHPPNGAWSAFKIIGGREDGATIRLSVVGQETRAGQRYFWLEVAGHGLVNGPAGRQSSVFISKSLVPGIGPDWGAPRELVVKYGTAPAMEMPVSQNRTVASPATELEHCHDATVVGWESVTVPAGTFHALHLKGKHNNGDLWVVPDLPFAVVKGTNGEAAGGREMVLTGHGSGATSAITERPQPYNPMLFMMMMRQQQGGRH